jgi:hypothetical protein
MTGNAKEAARVGQKVLAGGRKGRERAGVVSAERHAALVTNVVVLFNQLTERGHNRRGVAGKIARRLGMVSERHVRRIISDMQGGKSDSLAYSPPQAIVRRIVT